MTLFTRDFLIARQMSQLYAEAERRMLARVERRLAEGITQVGWNERKLLETQLMRKALEQEVERLYIASGRQATSMINLAYWRAAQRVENTFGGAMVTRTPVLAMQALERSLVTGLQGLNFAILRQTEDLYRQVVAEAAAFGVAGVEVRRDVARRILTDFQRRGITGFVDRAGRNWSLQAYANMASRTAMAQAHLQGTVDRLKLHGVRLGRIPDAPEECELCRPWEGRIVSLGARVPGYDHTLDDARSEGLFHPNCKHGVVAYIPELEGITKAPKTSPATEQRTRQPVAPRRRLPASSVARPPGTIATEADLRRYLRNELNIKNIDIAGLAPSLYQHVADGLFAALGQFPKRVRGEICDVLRMGVKGEYNALYGGLSASGDPIAWAGGRHGVRSLNLSWEYFGREANRDLLAASARCIREGFHADGYGAAADYWVGRQPVVHEVGHLVNNFFSFTTKERSKRLLEAQQAWQDLGGLSAGVSGYGHHNLHEFFAEAYVGTVAKDPTRYGSIERIMDRLVDVERVERRYAGTGVLPEITFG